MGWRWSFLQGLPLSPYASSLLAKIVIGVSPQQFLRTKPEQN
jgi:hypothetical protein